MKFTLPHFGEISPENLEEYYCTNIDFQGSTIQVDLNFINKSIDTSMLITIKNFIEKIESFAQQNQQYIQEDYNNESGETVKLYVEHHLTELSQEELSALVNFDDKATDPEIQLLAKLKLVRVGMYPDRAGNFAIFDYSIGKNITNYLVVINTNESGKLGYMTMES